MSDLQIVRLGTVHSVDKAKMTARVKFEDKGGIISGSLKIIKRKEYVIPSMEANTKNKVSSVKLKFDENGEPEEKEHTHNAYITQWIPEIGSLVLCIMIPGNSGDGFIIGEL